MRTYNAVFDTELRHLLLKKIETNMSESRHDGWRIALANTAFILTKRHI